jgi:hypothetical protein
MVIVKNKGKVNMELSLKNCKNIKNLDGSKIKRFDYFACVFLGEVRIMSKNKGKTRLFHYYEGKAGPML